MAEFVGNPSGAGRRFAIACSRCNQEGVVKLLDGALETLAGAFEHPASAPPEKA